MSLAQFEDCATSLPLYHQCYAGNRHDATQFPLAWEGMLKGWLAALERQPEQLTLVFDRGNTSKANLQQLDDRGKGHKGASVRRKIRRWTAREHLREFLEVKLEVEND